MARMLLTTVTRWAVPDSARCNGVGHWLFHPYFRGGSTKNRLHLTRFCRPNPPPPPPSYSMTSPLRKGFFNLSLPYIVLSPYRCNDAVLVLIFHKKYLQPPIYSFKILFEALSHGGDLPCLYTGCACHVFGPEISLESHFLGSKICNMNFPVLGG